MKNGANYLSRTRCTRCTSACKLAPNVVSKEVRCNQSELVEPGPLPPSLSALRNWNAYNTLIHIRSKFFTGRFLHFHATFPSSSFFPLFSARRRRRPGSAPRRAENNARDPTRINRFLRDITFIPSALARPHPLSLHRLYTSPRTNPTTGPPFAEASTIAGSLAAGSLFEA